MKIPTKCFPTALLLFATLMGHSQIFSRVIPSPQKEYFVQINNNQLLSQEITIAQYFIFLFELKGIIPADSLLSLLPVKNEANTLLFFEQLYSPYIEKGENPKNITWNTLSALPVTGINYAQAVAYCEYLNDNYSKKTQKGKSYSYSYRLPEQQEIIAIYNQNIQLAGKDSLGTVKVFRTDGRNPEECALINFALEPKCESDKQLISHRKYGMLLPSHLYPNHFGLCHLLGNVAEMTAQNGLAIGGSYAHPFVECIPTHAISYSKPEDWLGFRVIVDVEVY